MCNGWLYEQTLSSVAQSDAAWTIALTHTLDMLTRLILLSCAAALVSCRPQAPARPPAEILEYENNNIGVDGYDFRFQSSDGIARSEKGVLNNVGTENEAMSVTGEISFTTDDGKKVTIKFVSDENGYRPVVSTS